MGRKAERRIRGAVACAAMVVFGFGLLAPTTATALEAFDGRIQVHGFAEMQLRALNEKFSEQLDLAQWYNVLNVELEFDILPDGWGPLDLLQAYVRVEGRYDCIWEKGCGMFNSVNTYGDDAQRLPDRLTDGRTQDYSGVLQVGPTTSDNPSNLVQTLNGERLDDGTIIEDRGALGLSGLKEFRGADDIPNTADDPFKYVMSDFLAYAFTSTAHRGPDGGGGQKSVLGPWLPKNFIDSNAVLRNKANPFRGRTTPSPGGTTDGFIRWHTADPLVNGIDGDGNPVMPDPTNLANPFFQTPDQFPTELLEFLPPDLVFPGTTTFGTYTFLSSPSPAGVPKVVVLTDLALNDGVPTEDDTQSDAARGFTAFGGDYSGIVACGEPGGELAGNQTDPANADGWLGGCLPGANVRVVGGTSELPLRPAPDLSNLAEFDPTVAQGLYIPSRGLVHYFEHGDFDSLDMNFRESERSWNRGASQQDTKELKEAYFDMEFFDSRLWVRVGLQQIVWGKTELFRTTDQFNPQDLALATIPSLEESRIAVNSARFIYSLYEVGPLEDVRLEFAVNFDQMQPSDLGACGEPYTPDIVCGLTFGTFAHGFFGLGVAGVNRPSDPWKDLGGFEIGGRIEWRWDRFSFALTDFYGYDDLPSIERIMTFERNADLASGRPLITRLSPDNPRGDCATDSDALSMANAGDPDYRLSKDQYSVTASGIGIDGDCLGFGTPLTGSASNNALEWHHANQQLFTWVCAVSVGFSAGLDPGACAATLFNSEQDLVKGVVPIPFSELVSPLFAGDYRHSKIFQTITGAIGESIDIPFPALAINRDANDGFITAISGSALDCDDPLGTPTGVRELGCNNLRANGGFNQGPRPGTIGFQQGGNVVAKQLPWLTDFLTLDSTLTNEQRALLGCGPFFGIRCDTAGNFSLNDCDINLPGCEVLSSDDPASLTPAQRLAIEERQGFYRDVFPGAYNAIGGIDLLNIEGSVLVQSFPGFEGTPDDYITTSMAQAPGTIRFDGGPVCTRYVPGKDMPVKLPGCRGIDDYVVTTTEVIFTFEAGYDPSVDGCLLAPTIGTHAVVTLDSDGNDITGSQGMMSCFGQLTPGRGDFVRVPGFFQPFYPTTTRPCDNFEYDADCIREVEEYLDKRNSDSGLGDYSRNSFVRIQNASTLYHPLAGCNTDEEIEMKNEADPDRGPNCEFKRIPGLGFRDFDAEFLAGTAQIFQNEMAAVSWNFLMFLVAGSVCNPDEDEFILNESNRKRYPTVTDCLAGDQPPWTLGRCSFNQPQFCRAVKAFMGLAGVQRNVVRAGGNGTYGRRTLLWHSGGEIVLNYTKRNVFGFSMDFAEDRSKSNWGVEFTWIESIPFFDANEFDNFHHVDTFNLTVSADRPTFINFLNANRTFFFNTQWFFQYIDGHNSGMSSNGPFNALFTFAVITGYFQDRLNPSLITIYDFNSRSGGVLPSIQYRFTEAFSVAWGIGFFYGRTQLTDMSVNGFGFGNRAGQNANKDSTEQFISAVRKRDEVWLRVRWTF